MFAQYPPEPEPEQTFVCLNEDLFISYITGLLLQCEEGILFVGVDSASTGAWVWQQASCPQVIALLALSASWVQLGLEALEVLAVGQLAQALEV